MKIRVNGRVVEVGDEFANLSPEEQERTVDEIAASLPPERKGGYEGFMNQVNQGIADAAGGLVDLINPFDAYTGSAREGLTQGMEAIGAVTERGEPEGLVQEMARGAGQAAGSLIPAAKGAQLMQGAGGTLGRVAGDVSRGLTTRSALVAEPVAGAVSEGARALARDAGAPEWVQDTVALVAPTAIPATAAVARAGGRAGPTGRAIEAGKRVIAPYTQAGGRAVARQRMQTLAGGRERADELADRIETNTEIPLTPAQQTGDPNMLGLERLAADQYPEIRARLDNQVQQGQVRARDTVIDLGGDTEATRAFIADNRRAFKSRLDQRLQSAEEQVNSRLNELGPNVTEAENSAIVSEEITKAFTDAREVEDRLWDAVPRGAQVRTDNVRAVAAEELQKMPRAQQRDFPQVARELLTGDGSFSEVETVNELYGLYSEMRRVARSAKAGNDQNNNMARIANQIAEAALKDLGATTGDSRIGRTINAARAYSAELHETFDRGAVGLARQRTIDGDLSIEPETMLRRTLRPGPQGAVSSRQLQAGAGNSQRANAAISDYVRGLVSDSLVSPDGSLTIGNARRFLRSNADLVRQFPELRDEVLTAVKQGEDAARISERIATRLSAVESSASAAQRFLNAPAGKEVSRVLQDQNPARATRRLVNEVSKDASGQALAGLKGAFSRYIVDGSTSVVGGEQGIDPRRFNELMQDRNFAQAANVVFTSQERNRLRRIGRQLSLATGEGIEAANVGSSLSNARAPKFIEFMARIVAARQGAELGGGGGASLQTAQMASERAKTVLNSLMADRASQIIADAVEDPELFKALLTSVDAPNFDEKVLPRIVPYLVGSVSASATE